MSQGKRLAREDALPIIDELCQLLSIDTHQLTVCGSVRRNKETIGDVDLVVHPMDNQDYLNMLDEFLNLAYFGQGMNAGGRTTWGATKRLISYKGINFDVIIADEDQLGYKLWLSTGPGIANTAMMTLLKDKLSPIRMVEGYCWHVTYDRKHPKYEKARSYARLAKLSVPDEETFFKLIGLPYCHPQWRSEDYYKRLLWQDGQPSTKFIEAHYIEGTKPLIQNTLF